MTKEEIVARINAFENKNGESFVDQLGYIFPTRTFMTWALGKGYLKPDQYRDWFAAYRKHVLEADDMNYFLYDDEYEEEDSITFSLVRSAEYEEEKAQESFKILAEFLVETKVFIEEFLSETE